MPVETSLDLAFASATDLSRALDGGLTTATEIIDNTLGRIETHDRCLHAFVEIFENVAREMAQASDRRRREARARGPLDGIPFAVKDLFDVSGYLTAGGSRALPAKPASGTATAVKRLEAAGMIAIGKVQTVEFAFGGWGTNPICGTPVNPRDRTVARVPGGSSSGSGVAVAAGLIPAALGTDTGGSVRNPAAMCGTVGLKTSVGLIGRSGLLPLATTFDSIGPLTRSVTDAAMLLAVLKGHDPDDPATFGISGADPLHQLDEGIAGLRLRIPSPHDLASVDGEVHEQFKAALADLETLGATIDERPMPRAPEVYMASAGNIMAAEAWHNLRQYIDALNSVVHPVIRERVSKGRDVDVGGYFNLVAERRRMQAEFERYLAGADAFLTPTAPITAPPIEGIDEQSTPLGTFTRLVNLMDMAALSVPIGSITGLPTALQIVVRRFDDARALRIGRALERHRGGLFEPPVGYGAA